MRFALSLDPGGWKRGDTSDSIRRLARLADAGGIDALWLTEDPDGWDAFAVLGAISQLTEQIELGTGVTNPYLRHPDLMAASVATLDRLAPGRAFLGLGRGQPEWYKRGLGMEIGSPLQRLAETIDLLRQWERSEAASIDGEFHIDHWTRSVRPTKHIPIYVAAVGPKALDLAGRVADGVLFNMLATPDYLARAIGTVRAAAHAAGRDHTQLRFIANPSIFVTADIEPLLRSRKRFVASVLALPGMEVLLENPDLDVPTIMRKVRALMKTDEILARGGAFADFARDGDTRQAIAAIPDALVRPGSAIGTLEQVREQLTTFQTVGVTDLILDQRGLPAEAGAIRQLLDAFRI